MAIADKLTSAYEVREQANDFFTARATMMPLREDATRIEAEVQAIIDKGIFDTVDAELKAAGLQVFNIIQQLNVAFTNPDVAEFLDWRP